ncbi:MAG: sigma-70 family RNA polymerase sigma factor [Bacteroidetes bacterium]|nr:sigma-70 family RNA polymerase sigma factor [Bacteroidota bacterium]
MANSISSISDSELVDKLKSGNADAFKAVYYHHFGMVKYFITKNQGNEQDAEDIFQETIYVLYNLVLKPDFSMSAKLKTLIYSIARNLWITELRKRGNRATRIKSYERYLKVDMSSHGHLVQAREEAFSKIEKAFKVLGENCQKILGMFYFHRKSMEEIATLLDYTNADNAKNQKYRCIQNLKRMI